MYRASAAVGETYTAALMSEVERRLGWRWQHRLTPRGVQVPEVAGVGQDLVERFSACSAQVEANLAGRWTLDKALAVWARQGHGPGPRTMVLVDEASMATTPKLDRAVAAALQSGGVVLLVGDPRQLTAVRAGGGLEVVADAAGSPRAQRHTPLRGAAGGRRQRTPRRSCRHGRVPRHGRISSGGRHAMMAEAFDA